MKAETAEARARHAEEQRMYKKRHPERIKSSQRQYREKNKDKIRAVLKRWYENLTPEQREYHRARQRDWKKRTKASAKQSAYNRKHREKSF